MAVLHGCELLPVWQYYTLLNMLLVVWLHPHHVELDVFNVLFSTRLVGIVKISQRSVFGVGVQIYVNKRLCVFGAA